ncbi:hypothetical protein HYS72_01650 [Candidatus Pacearchaeota archaeon]|nr:hypothetical protein [Candidatus Pacearchaeota archaeon]MBI2057018.1 hypothetical protein [Candidatus Pacearchaeota archaeon]
MGHLKRQSVSKNWPIIRKGTAFVVKPTSKKGIPLLIVLRDLLKIAQTREEVKTAIQKKYLLINNRAVKDEKIGMALFDTLSILPSKIYYRLELSEKGKFELKKIKEEESNKKIAKIINKKIISGKKIQLNLNDGGNFLVEPKFSCMTNDSAIINFKDKKIEKCLPLKEKSNAIVFAGKHSGKIGQIEEIKERKMAIIDCNKNKINVLIKQLMVIE